MVSNDEETNGAEEALTGKTIVEAWRMVVLEGIKRHECLMIPRKGISDL